MGDGASVWQIFTRTIQLLPLSWFSFSLDTYYRLTTHQVVPSSVVDVLVLPMEFALVWTYVLFFLCMPTKSNFGAFTEPVLCCDDFIYVPVFDVPFRQFRETFWRIPYPLHTLIKWKKKWVKMIISNFISNKFSFILLNMFGKQQSDKKLVFYFIL